MSFNDTMTGDFSVEVAVGSEWVNLKDVIEIKRLADASPNVPIFLQDTWKRISIQPADGDVELSLDAVNFNRYRVLSEGDVEWQDSGSIAAIESARRTWIRSTSGFTPAVATVKRFTFAGNISAGDVFVVGNLTGIADTDFAVGGSAATSISNMVTYFGANTSWILTSDATTITFTAIIAGTVGNSLTLTENATQVTKSTVTPGVAEVPMTTLVGLWGN